MKKTLVWLRRDLRLEDHHALSYALHNFDQVYCCFVFDPLILDKLPSKQDRRVTFLMNCVDEVDQTLRSNESALIIRYGNPLNIIPQLAQELKVETVLANRDYEPYAKLRDSQVKKKLGTILFKTFKDHVFFETPEVLSKTETLYRVYTPYKNSWLNKFDEQQEVIANYSCPLNKIAPVPTTLAPPQNWHKEIGFMNTPGPLEGGRKQALKRLKNFAPGIKQYADTRNFPANLKGTSGLSPYLRFGCVSIRECLKTAVTMGGILHNQWLMELIWRDFYQMILDTHPHVEKGAFKKEYDGIPYENDVKLFTAWKDGLTGFPLVDAAMRCFKQTGLMHNRLRMVVASFLCKTLLIDWKWGEEYFAHNLMDFDLAANSGGWQWSSSSGCDAQPYFRIFNPYSQSEKFDPDGIFIKTWVPELKNYPVKWIHAPHTANEFEQASWGCMVGQDYPGPIVDYSVMRQKAMNLYKEHLQKR